MQYEFTIDGDDRNNLKQWPTAVRISKNCIQNRKNVDAKKRKLLVNTM